MSADTTASATIRGELTASPGGSPRARHWHLDVGAGIRDVGAAGIAVLTLPSGVRAAFDYQQPDCLLALEVPTVGDEPDLPPGSVDDEDLELVASLTGADAAAHLEAAATHGPDEPARFEAHLEVTEAQAIAGRMALLTTYLDDRTRPVDGLWAAELVALAYRWGQLALMPLANHFAHLAAPALRLLRPDWPAHAPGDDPRALHLLDTLLACQQAAPSAVVGPLLATLRERLGTSDHAVLPRGLPRLEPPEHAAAGRPTHRADQPQITAASPLSVLIDHSLDGWVASVAAQLDGRIVHVRLEPTPLLAGIAAAQRITTQIVTSGPDAGVMLTAGLSMLPQPDGSVTAQLLIPSGYQTDELTVILGRHLTLAGQRDAAGFARRQAQHRARRVLDARRQGLAPTTAGDPARQAPQAGDRQADAPSLVEAAVPAAFLAEALPISELIDVTACAGSSNPEVLAAARSLLWPNVPAQAAGLEAARIATGSDRGALRLAELDALLFDTLPTGEAREAIALLDRAAASLHDPGTPVLPLYLVVDESGAMLDKEQQLRAGINELLHALHDAPADPPEIPLGVLGFADSAHVLQPLTDCRRIEVAPSLVLGGTCSYRAAFEQVRDAITQDVAALQGSKHEVLRPTVMFLTGGTPNQQEDWLGAYKALTEDFEHAPDVLALGLGDADAAMLASIATRTDWAYRVDKTGFTEDDAPQLFDALTRALDAFGLDVVGSTPQGRRRRTNPAP